MPLGWLFLRGFGGEVDVVGMKGVRFPPTGDIRLKSLISDFRQEDSRKYLQ